MQTLGTLSPGTPQKVVGGLPQRTWYLGSPRALRPLTSRFLGAKVELQVEVLHHVAQLIIVRVFPELRGRGRFRARKNGRPPPPPPSKDCLVSSRRESLHQALGQTRWQEETAGEAKSSKLSGGEPAPLAVNNTHTWGTLQAEASKLRWSRG